MCFAWISEQIAIVSLYSISMTGFKLRQRVFTVRYELSSNRANTVLSLKG